MRIVIGSLFPDTRLEEKAKNACGEESWVIERSVFIFLRMSLSSNDRSSLDEPKLRNTPLEG